MKPQKGYYSVLQYCPDLGRFEAVNVGVLLFCPESGFLKAITTDHNRRISRFFGKKGHDWKRVKAFKKGIEDRLQNEKGSIKTIDDLKHFIAMRANLIQITNPLPIKVENPEKDLISLFQKILSEPHKSPSRTSLKSFLASKFTSAGLDKKIVADVTVQIPVLDKEIEIPFGFQNGRFNLINPVSFRTSDVDSAVRTACKYAVEGESIYETPDKFLGKMQLFVVGQFKTQDDQIASTVRRVFDKYRVRLFEMDEVSKLIDEIQRDGKVIESA